VCEACGANVDTSVNNEPKDHIVKCLNCEADLLIPKGCLQVYCGSCGHVFRLPKNYFSKAEYLTNIYEYIDHDY